MNNSPPKIIQTPHVWAFTTYFAEGFPYTIIRTISSVFFRDMKVSLEAIGLTSLFGLPWVIKFLWGPKIDQFGTKRQWMLTMQCLLVLGLFFVAFAAPLAHGAAIIAILFFVGSFLSATHDMAIDGYYMEALDKEGQSKFVGYRVMAYRISMMTGTGIIVTISAMTSWRFGFFFAALMLGILLLYHFFFLPRVEMPQKPLGAFYKSVFNFKILLWCMLLCLLVAWLVRNFPTKWWTAFEVRFPFLEYIGISGWVGIGLLMALTLLVCFKNRLKKILLADRDSFYSRAFMTYMDRKGIGIAIAFIVFMRTGESMLASMASPFMVDLGIKAHYGWISGGIGLPFSIVGAMLGGWLISRHTLKKTIFPFLLLQNVTNIIYMILALGLNHYVELNTGSDTLIPIGRLNLVCVASVHAFDQFAGGLGTAVLVTFLMRTCLSEFKAAHFAIGTGLMNLSGVLSGVISGYMAQRLGYGYFFGISFLASLPGMAMIFFLPFLDAETEKSMLTDAT